MTSNDASLSLATAVAIALGASKTTELSKQVLASASGGELKAPSLVKSFTATAIAVGASVLIEQGARRRVLTAFASAGLASMLHTWERTSHWQGDINQLLFFQQGARRK